MFTGEFREKTDKEVPIDDTTYRAFKTMLWFIYSGELDFGLDDDNKPLVGVNDVNAYNVVAEVCKLADKYDIKKIIKMVDCITVTDGNFEWICRLHQQYKSPNMRNQIVTYIKRGSHLRKEKQILHKMNEKCDNIFS